MGENQVAKVQTAIAPIPWTVAALLAWHHFYGSYPSKRQLAVLWGQYMIETGGKSAYNYNLGNVKHVDGDGYDWFDLPGTWEMVNGQKVVLPEGSKGRRFRSYKNLEHGMRSHLDFLKNRRYKNAWRYVEQGLPREFSYALKAGFDQEIGTRDDYYTADPKLYADGLEARYKTYLNKTYFEDAVRSMGVTLASVGKTFPSVSAPALSGEVLLLVSGVLLGISHVLKIGARGDEVRAWQKFCRNIGFSPGKIDGIFHTLTRQATIRVQRHLGVTADGIVGPETLQAANELKGD